VTEPIIVVDSSEIREGTLDDVRQAMHDLASFVEANVPRVLAYHMYLDEARTRMTVVQVHADSSSAAFHMKTSASMFRAFAELIRLSTMDVYGKPSDELLELLRQKVRLLGGAKMTVHVLEAGFTRLSG